MKKNNNSLLLTILGGAVFCFVFLGMAFIFTNNTKTLKKGSNYVPNQFIDSEEISLGDETSCQTYDYYCPDEYEYINTACCKDHSSDSPQTCTANGGTVIGSSDCCRGGTEARLSKCASCNAGSYLSDGKCYTKLEPTITGSGVSVMGGATASISPTATYDGVAVDGTFSCSSSDSNKLRVDHGNCSYLETTTVTSNTNVTVTITFTPTEAKYAVVTKTVTVTIKPETCDDGYRMGQSGQCEKCDINTYGTGGRCDGRCPDGKSCPRGSTSEDDCVAQIASVKPDIASVYVSPPGSSNYKGLNVQYSKVVKFTAYDSTGAEIDVDRWATGGKTEAIESTTQSGKYLYVTIKGWGCGNDEVTATATANAYSKTGKVEVKSFGEWKEYDWNKPLPAGGTAFTLTAVQNNVCTAYDTKTVVDGQAIYKYRYDRCCKGSGSSACYAKTACYKKTDNTYIWTDNPGDGWEKQTTVTKQSDCNGTAIDESQYTRFAWTGSPETTWTKVTSKTSSTACINPPACYKDEDGGYKWTDEPKESWELVPGVSKEKDCKEDEEEACYKDPDGKYDWGLHAKDKGYTLITSKKTKEECKDPEEGEACYRKDDDYVWSATKPSGYELVEGVTDPVECGPEEAEACYLYNGSYKWGKYDKVSGYTPVTDSDGFPIPKEECKDPTTEACYKKPDGTYVWGEYSDNSSYEIVPSVTDKDQCKSDVPVPKTDINISKIIYIFMAVLMACGVGFIYYSSVMKKEN